MDPTLIKCKTPRYTAEGLSLAEAHSAPFIEACFQEDNKGEGDLGEVRTQNLLFYKNTHKRWKMEMEKYVSPKGDGPKSNESQANGLPP